MHSAHGSVGVSRLGQSSRDNGRFASPLTIDVFAKPAEQAIVRRLIAQLAAFSCDADWLMRLQVDRGRERQGWSDASDCMLIVGGEEPFGTALMAEFESCSERGGAIVALNTGAQTTPGWYAFCRRALGADLEEAVPTSRRLTFRISAGHQFHPVVQGVAAWELDPMRIAVLGSEAESILEGVTDGEKRLLAWTIERGRHRTFSTLLGTLRDFDQPSFIRLVGNALRWVQQSP
jgi:hypothetical protein